MSGYIYLRGYELLNINKYFFINYWLGRYLEVLK